jgi:lipoprotein-releasing system ATP-binding protein
MSRGISVQAVGLGRHYRMAGHKIVVLEDLGLTLEPGERIAVVGRSGSGKSTLLHQLGLLDRASEGSLRLGGRVVDGLNDAERATLRSREIGYVFQAHNLLPEHTAMMNVMLPVLLAGGSRGVATQRAQALLGAVGLGSRVAHRPGELSGGEQQRVALARALVMGPSLVLADEPTGNLDPRTASGVFDLLLQLNQQLGSTLVVVTHSKLLADRFDRRFVLDEGRLRES